MRRKNENNLLGGLREFLMIQNYKATTDEYGYEMKEWIDVRRLRCKVEPMKAEDKNSLGMRKSWDGKTGLVTTAKHYVFIIREVEVRNLDRIIYKNEPYEVVEIEELAGGRFLALKVVQIC